MPLDIVSMAIYVTLEGKIPRTPNNGSAMAQFNIGQHYLHGSNGLPKNRVQALNWLKKAANNGHAQAKLVLAGLQ
jgi:TPR repeat protein